MLDEHPLVPTSAAVRAGVERVADAWPPRAPWCDASPLLPDLANVRAPLYASFDVGFVGTMAGRYLPASEKPPPQRSSLTTTVSKPSAGGGAVMSHREGPAADTARMTLQQQWSAVFREWDVVLCPPMPTPAFLHDHTPMAERSVSTSTAGSFRFLISWSGPENRDSHQACRQRRRRLTSRDTDLPIGVQIVGPYLEDRTPIGFAALMEREFGGFVPPPGYAD